MSKGNQKRGQCSNCPSIKRVITVLVHGCHLDLCESCRLALSKIVREREAGRCLIRASTPSEQLDHEIMAEDIEAALSVDMVA